MTPMKSRRSPTSNGLRRALAAVAAVAIMGGAWQVSTHGSGEIGVLVMPGATADPSGPPGPTGGPGMDGGQQFQPPQMPGQQPEYQGGNQPPLDQSNGVSIYNSGAPQPGQQPGGQQGGQQPGNQQPAHGTMPPNYETATPFTQGPGKANPDYQAPQQNSPQQPQQGQQQQPQQQQEPQQQEPQNQQDQDTQQLQDMKQRCDQAGQIMSVARPVFSMGVGAGSALAPPRDPLTGPGCSCTNPNGQKSLSNDEIKDQCFDKNFKEDLGPTMVKSAFMSAFRMALQTAVVGCVVTSEIGCWEGAILGFVGGFVTSLPISALIKAAKAAALCYFEISIPDSTITLVKDILWPF